MAHTLAQFNSMPTYGNYFIPQRQLNGMVGCGARIVSPINIYTLSAWMMAFSLATSSLSWFLLALWVMSFTRAAYASVTLL